MAAPAVSPSGFSYAQAAKGRSSTTSSQLPSSKVTSGTATPATGMSTDLSPAGNWAESVESSVEDNIQTLQKSHEPQSKPAPVKDVAVERAKSESRPNRAASGISSPDLAASTTTSATDDSSSLPNGTPSDSTWETKSQASEPAWIAERKERQGTEGTGKGGNKDSKESSPAPPLPKPPVLQDAPPPAVNPWAKRAEDAKTKPVVAASSTQTIKPVSVSVPVTVADSKDTNASSAEQQKKSESITRDNTASQLAGTDTKKPSASQAPRGSESRANGRQAIKPANEDARNGIEHVPATRSIQRESKGAAAPPLPPPSSDQTSWPTPDTVPEKERKDTAADKDTDDANESDATQGTKAAKKTWKVLPVTPNILWETQEMNRPRGPAGDKGPRSSNPTRARGGFRGGANGPKGGDRAHPKALQDTDLGPRGRQAAADRDAMPPPAKPSRAASAGQSRDTSGLSASESKPVGLAITGGETTTTAGSAPQFSTQRTKSPNPVNVVAAANGQDPAKAPSPIPRTSSTAAQPKDAGDASSSSNSTRDMNSTRSTASDSRKEGRPFDSYGKEWSGAPRGGKRGGRGRGGSREFANGHQANSPYHASFADFTAAAANLYGIPPSPSGFQSPRGNHQFGHQQQQQQGRGGWSRSGQRAQSIPLDSVYNGSNNSRFPTFNQMAPVPGYMPNMYDQYGFPLTAMPYSPAMDQQYLMDMVSTQLEYYFSVDNLLKDMFLRKNMDSQGFVFLDVIANFNRIKQLTVDKDLLRAVCLRSESIEIRVGDDNKERLRKREEWERFLLPVEQRDPGAQNDGPTQLQRPEQPQFWGRNTMGFRGQGNIPSHPRRSYDSGFAGMNGLATQFTPFGAMMESPYGDGPHGEEMRGRTHKSPLRDNSIPPNHPAMAAVPEEKDSEPDVYPNEHMSVLTVVVKTHHARLPHQHFATRTFSNGSIDARAIFNPDGEKSTDEHGRAGANGEASTNGDTTKRSLSRMASPSYGRSPEKDASGPEISLFWVKDKDMPTDSLPTGAALEPYMQLRFKALDQRSHAATGTCPYDLDVLYQFWSHFLIRNFNNTMYTEFKYYAHDDATQRSSIGGLQNLVQFYAKALASSSNIRDRIVNDYVHLVKNEPAILEGQAFKQLRAAWRDGALNLKNRKKLTETVDDGLRERLES